MVSRDTRRRTLIIISLAVSTPIILHGLIMALGEGGEGRVDPSPPYEDWALRPPDAINPWNIEPTRTDMSGLEIAVAQDTSVHAVWSEYIGTTSSVLYSCRPCGASYFTAPIRLSSAELNASDPDIEIGPDGVVHSVWIQREYRDELFWSKSTDGGRSWSAPKLLYWEQHLFHPSLAIDVNRTIFFAVGGEWEAWAGTRFPHSMCEYVRVIALTDTSNELANVTIVSERSPGVLTPYKPTMIVDDWGTPHVVVGNWSSTTLYRTTEGGLDWTSMQLFDGANHPYEVKVAALSGGGIVVAATHRTVGEPIHPCGYRLDVVTVTNTSQGLSKAIHRLPSIDTLYGAFDIKTHGDEVWIASLGFPNETSGLPFIDGPFRTKLYVARFTEVDGWADPIELSSTPGDPLLEPSRMEDEYWHATLSLDIERDGKPVVGASLMDRPNGTLDGYVWRVNHAPSIPQNVTEAGGGWLYGSPMTLQVLPSMDPDGDDIEYMMSLWSSEGGPRVTSGWQSDTAFDAEGLRHGAYNWSAEARDASASSGPSEGWWFRLDLAAPLADADGPYVCDEGQPLVFDGSASVDDGPIVLWEWDLDMDGAFEVSLPEAVMTYILTDDYRGPARLRVTDEAGRQGYASTMLIILNVPPSVTIECPSRVSIQDEIFLKAIIVDPGTDDVHVTSWTIDGRSMADGDELRHRFDVPGDHIVCAIVTDEDGGSSVATRIITAYWPTPPTISIGGPMEVMEGDWFAVWASDDELNPFADWRFTWRLDGVVSGTGRETLLLAGRPGSLGISLYADDGFGNSTEALTNVTVIERLRPVICLGVTNVTSHSMSVAWTKCNQAEVFERYVLLLSLGPRSVGSGSNVDWNWTEVSVFDGIDSLSHRLTGLEPNTTYYLRVDIEGRGQRASSNTFTTTTPAEPSEDTNPPPGGRDDDGWRAWTQSRELLWLIIIVLTVAIIAWVAFRRKRDY